MVRPGGWKLGAKAFGTFQLTVPSAAQVATAIGRSGQTLLSLGDPRLEGVVVGKALYSGSLALEGALAVVASAAAFTRRLEGRLGGS